MASHHSDPSRPRGFWNQFGEVTRGLADHRQVTEPAGQLAAPRAIVEVQREHDQRRRDRDRDQPRGHERHGSLLPGTSADLPRTVKRATTIQFTTPALGDSYDFAVETECCWCASGDMTEDDLQVKIDNFVPVFERIIRRAVRAEARKHVPYRPDEAESAINAAVKATVEAELAATPDLDGAVLNLEAVSQVSIAEPVRALQQDLLGQRMRYAASLDISEMIASRLGELRTCWREFIRDGQEDWFTPYAVQMAEKPEHAAAILFAMSAQRRKDAETLVDRVAAITHGYEAMDLLEFAAASDTALRRTYEIFGIPMPEAGPESFDDAPPELP